MRLKLPPFPWSKRMRLEKLGSRLPSSAWRLFHAPLPRFLRELSLSENLERDSSRVGLPESFSIDPRITKGQFEIGALKQKSDLGVQILRLTNATVLGGGIIVHKGAIHLASSVYRTLSPLRVLKAAQEFHSGKTGRPMLDAATIVSRQFVNNGTWGDYFLEFLMPMAWIPVNSGRIVLCDCGFISKYASKESEVLGFDCHDIPDGGIEIKNLEVIGPCQIFNNFEEANIGRLRERFPVTADRLSSKRVFLSRLGVTCGNTKNARAIANEADVAAYLASEGFDILYPHEMANHEIRARIAEAEVIVGCWGAAMLNTAWSRPGTVIELVSEKIWSPTAVKLSLANGVERHIAIRTTDHRIPIDFLSKILHQQDRGKTGTEFARAA